MPNALQSATAFPVTEIECLDGGSIRLGKPEEKPWQLIFVYRGIHCPICRQYLQDLEPKLEEFADMGIDVVAVSADTEAKARKLRADLSLSVPLGYGMDVAQMQALGLYVSDPRSPEETDRPFAEPGLFLVNPEGNLHMVDISNAPFLRPELEKLPSRIKYVLENDYPIRGTHES
ncbi:MULTISPECIES: peroxiredoxin-like family protein [Roseovarius]|jgi:peroxiredoxin|uniref:peroxiredoxin-like family protein n=1 Tax=Roseovarius TaxID=74030 RepID=UPI00273F4CCD|nr:MULTISPECIES: peroxiredoxin-like family protein [unclassified Roseovarius]